MDELIFKKDEQSVISISELNKKAKSLLELYFENINVGGFIFVDEIIVITISRNCRRIYPSLYGPSTWFKIWIVRVSGVFITAI